MNSLIIPIVVVVLVLLSYRLVHNIFVRRLERGPGFHLRPLPGFDTLQTQIGRSVESGHPVHITLGRASLNGPNSPTSLAAANMMGQLAYEAAANDAPPLVTVGDGTMLLAAQEKLQHSFEQANRPNAYKPWLAQFVAHNTTPYVYAGGTSGLMHQDKITGNVLMGQLGPEMMIMAEAAQRQDVAQVIGTDDPTTMALGTAVTANNLIGEELFAAAAYLDDTPEQIASLRIQDIVRLLIIIGILAWAVIQFVTNLQ
jgi:hypothetical protein